MKMIIVFSRFKRTVVMNVNHVQQITISHCFCILHVFGITKYKHTLCRYSPVTILIITPLKRAVPCTNDHII